MLSVSKQRGHFLREALHHNNPPITSAITIKLRPSPHPRGDSVAATGGVSVGCAGVADGLGDGGIVVGLGVNVGVAGRLTRSSNFCPGRMMDAVFNPFQFIRSASETSYKPAIHESVSPLRTV